MSRSKWPETALSTFLLLSDAVNPGWPRWRSLFRFWYRVESRCITTTTTIWAGHTKNGQIACGCHHSLNKSSGQGQPTWVIEFLFCSDLCFKSVEKMLFNKFTHTHTYKHTHTRTWGQCHLFLFLFFSRGLPKATSSFTAAHNEWMTFTKGTLRKCAQFIFGKLNKTLLLFAQLLFALTFLSRYIVIVSVWIDIKYSSRPCPVWVINS